MIDKLGLAGGLDTFPVSRGKRDTHTARLVRGECAPVKLPIHTDISR